MEELISLVKLLDIKQLEFIHIAYIDNRGNLRELKMDTKEFIPSPSEDFTKPLNEEFLKRHIPTIDA